MASPIGLVVPDNTGDVWGYVFGHRASRTRPPEAVQVDGGANHQGIKIRKCQNPPNPKIPKISKFQKIQKFEISKSNALRFIKPPGMREWESTHHGALRRRDHQRLCKSIENHQGRAATTVWNSHFQALWDGSKPSIFMIFDKNQ